MSGSAILEVYPVARAAMVAALAHDRSGSLAALGVCEDLLRGHDSGAVREALDGWRAAVAAGAWSQVSTRLWQLMCSLPYGFPPDQSTLPPQAGAEPLVTTDCLVHGRPGSEGWVAFCPACGASLVRPAEPT